MRQSVHSRRWRGTAVRQSRVDSTESEALSFVGPPRVAPSHFSQPRNSVNSENRAPDNKNAGCGGRTQSFRARMNGFDVTKPASSAPTARLSTSVWPCRGPASSNEPFCTVLSKQISDHLMCQERAVSRQTGRPGLSSQVPEDTLRAAIEGLSRACPGTESCRPAGEEDADAPRRSNER